MEERPRDVRELILERVFPDLRYGGDPDIERYFELRASGRMLDALAIYKTRLRPRYPDDAKRVILLKLYRTHAPAFGNFLHGILMERANEIVDRIRNNIDALVSPLTGTPMRDTYAVLKAVERIARLLPDDTESARAMAWSYAEYARMLDHRKLEAERVGFLLSEFYDQAVVDDDTPADFIAASLATEESRRTENRETRKKNFFDLSRIEFDQADVRRIEIAQGFDRDEDIVLAYCYKYWLRIDDPAFERIIWLYSRKYETRHYDVFKAIKTGRHRKYSDDDILTMVATTLATRYSYTVQGDLYMQMAWRRLKANLYAPSPMVAKQEARQPRSRKRTAPKPAPIQAEPSSVPAEKPRLRRATVSPSPIRKEPRPQTPMPRLQPTGSISDKIKRLSGRAYDVYKELFLASVRSHIHAALMHHRAKPGISGDDINRAENIVYEFMERNYANTYMDWTSSEYKTRIGELGVSMESLDDIIEACYRKIGA
jgi:hypothetical protein